MKMKKILAMIILLLMAVCASGFAIGRSTKSYEPRYDYTVKAGDTLWNIAENNVSENEDIRDWIAKVKEINGININEEPLHAGQQIVIYRH